MAYIGAILLFIASLVQSVVLPQTVPVAARPQFVVLLVIAVCLVESLYDGAIWGFMGGLMLDLMNLPLFPVGSNALIFAQRYRTLEAETTAATVLSTLAFVVTAPLWLAVLAHLG